MSLHKQLWYVFFVLFHCGYPVTHSDVYGLRTRGQLEKQIELNISSILIEGHWVICTHKGFENTVPEEVKKETVQCLK